MRGWRAAGQHALLLIPLALYLTLGMLYLLAIPVGESPDEPGHLQCIEQVTQLRRLPQVEPAPSGEWWSRTTLLSGHMCYHMPLYYVAAGFVQLSVHYISQSPLHFQFPPSNPDWTSGAPAMFVHEDGWGLAETPAITAVRFFSLALGLVTVGATYRVATMIYPGRAVIGATAATLVAGWPQFVFMSRAVSNDLLATALSVVVLAILLNRGKPHRYLLAALVASLATLTKLTALFTMGLVITAYILEYWLCPGERKQLRRSGLGALVILAITATLIGLVPTLRVHFVTGLNAFSGITPSALTATYWGNVLQLTVSSGWARFGWMNVGAPSWQGYIWWTLVLGLSVWGLAVLWRQHWRLSRFTLAVLLTWTVAVVAAYLRINLDRFQPQFRFAFSLLPVLATFTAAGYQHLSGSRPFVVVGALALVLLLVNLWLILQLVIPTYYI